MFFGERERERGVQGDRKTENREKEERQRDRELEKKYTEEENKKETDRQMA
jgi:hypothetical protein